MRRLVKDALTKIEDRRSERPLNLTVKIASVQRDSVGRFLVPFTVMNAEERPAGGALTLDFQIYQDGQPVLRYAVSENTPGSRAYFLTASPVSAGAPAEERMVQITIALSCERGRGEQSTFWFRS